jgi:GNAT superfamily N-acetyltransferase
MPAPAITTVTEADLDDLLPLVRGYLDFYGASPDDAAVLGLSRALIADPEREGVQFIARDDQDRPVGFATVFWWWSTLQAKRIAQMNDLFVTSDARGSGAAEALIDACVQACRDRGDIAYLGWQTAKDNLRAQAVYDRIGGQRSEWVDYSLDT